MSWLNIDLREAEELADELHGERVLAYKYRYKCECGEICTVYEEKLVRDGFLACEICGNELSAEEIKIKAKKSFEISVKDLQELCMEFDHCIESKKCASSLLVTYEREEKKMEIFIGSSSEAVEYMERIALMVEELKHTPLMWNASGKDIFRPNTNTIDAIIDISKRVSAAIFVFNADDKVWNQRSALDLANSTDAVRDNVLFEYGLFMGALGKTKVCFVCKGKPRLASDLKGITYIDGDLGEIQVKMKLKDWINGMEK